MQLSAPINELKRKAKLLRRDAGITHHQALDTIAKQEGYANWSILIRKFEEHKFKPNPKVKVGFQLTNLPLSDEYRAEAIDVANSAFEHVFHRIEPDNPVSTRKLWDVEKFVDEHHFTEELLPIDSEYALSLIESGMLFYVVDLAQEADGMASAS